MFEIFFLYDLFVVALIEFDEPSEAQKAFKKLAYTRFKYLPLYLEWAPEDAFTGPPQKQTIASKKTDVKENVEDKDENEEDDDDDDEPEPDTTLFVKNLKFSTTEEQLRKVKHEWCKLKKNTFKIFTKYFFYLPALWKNWEITLRKHPDKERS